MNKRIDKLIDDARLTAVAEMFEVELTKFAELIVKECLVVINQSNGVGDDDVIRISKDVEKHFGVEE
jgi:hypothetical protein